MSLALSTALWAESPEKKGLEVINRSTAEAHIGFLADDDLEGREAGFRGGRIAGDYIVANLSRLLWKITWLSAVSVISRTP